MSYLSHWKLNRSPFSLSGSQRGVFTGGTIEEAIARLDFLADQHKKLGIILGPSGIGKSTLLNYFSAKRNSQVPREQVVLVDMSGINEEVIAARVAAALGIIARHLLFWPGHGKRLESGLGPEERGGLGGERSEDRIGSTWEAWPGKRFRGYQCRRLGIRAIDFWSRKYTCAPPCQAFCRAAVYGGVAALILVEDQN